MRSKVFSAIDESKLMTVSLPETDSLSLKSRTTMVESSLSVIASTSEIEKSDSDWSKSSTTQLEELLY